MKNDLPPSCYNLEGLTINWESILPGLRFMVFLDRGLCLSARLQTQNRGTSLPKISKFPIGKGGSSSPAYRPGFSLVPNPFWSVEGTGYENRLGYTLILAEK